MPVSAKQRKAIPRSAFVYPPGSRVGGKRGAYPIDTLARARGALSRAGQSRTKGSYATVARKVRARYGERVASVGRKRGTVSRPGYRKGRRKGARKARGR